MDKNLAAIGQFEKAVVRFGKGLQKAYDSADVLSEEKKLIEFFLDRLDLKLKAFQKAFGKRGG